MKIIIFSIIIISLFYFSSVRCQDASSDKFRVSVAATEESFAHLERIVLGNPIVPRHLHLLLHDPAQPPFPSCDVYTRFYGHIPFLAPGADPLGAALFDNKRRWLRSMARAGLSRYVPAVFPPSSAQFPCVLKLSSVHFGTGVFAIPDPDALAARLAALPPGAAFHIEEALTGMGPAEMAAFGSAARGALLSLRCLTRVHVQSLIDADGVFIRGVGGLQTEDEYFGPCGAELVAVLGRMFSDFPGYRGPFCINAKADAKGALKILEVNRRVCGTLPDYPELVMSTFAPLAVANYELGARQGREGEAPAWYRRMLPVRAFEAEMLRTGGSPDNATVVPQFDLKVRYRKQRYWGEPNEWNESLYL